MLHKVASKVLPMTLRLAKAKYLLKNINYANRRY